MDQPAPPPPRPSIRSIREGLEADLAHFIFEPLDQLTRERVQYIIERRWRENGFNQGFHWEDAPDGPRLVGTVCFTPELPLHVVGTVCFTPELPLHVSGPPVPEDEEI